ncbi:hypothetical protein [Streptomyces acidicola]|nr:hypothetical protein [Streptomyces acidicola]
MSSLDTPVTPNPQSDTSGRGSLPLAYGPAPVLGVGGAAHLLFGAMG